MTSSKVLDTKPKRTVTSLLGALLVLVGLANFGNSVLGAIALLVAGLFVIPKSREILSAKVPAPANSPLVGKALVVLLTVAGFGITGSAIKDADLAVFLRDKPEITQKIRSKISSNEVDAARDLVDKYLRAAPTDPELQVLREEVVAAKKKADQIASAKVEAGLQKEGGPLTGGDPDLIGKCLGFIGMEINAAGSPQAIHPSFQRYLNDQSDYAQRIVELTQRYPSCIREGVDITSCLRSNGVSDWNINLLLSYNTGITMFKTMRAVASAACMG